MATQPYLIFSLHNTRYAIAAKSVTEIFLLPELTPIAESPPDIVGLLNLHSVYVPVMHLDLRFGHTFDQCNLTDSVIVLESQGLEVGVVVHQVEAVNEIDDQYIQADLTYGRDRNINQAFIKGIINLDDEVIMLLNGDNLVRHPESLKELIDGDEVGEEAGLSSANFYEQYFPVASDHVKEILHQRAANLRQTEDEQDLSELISIAIVGIDGRYFGLDLSIVREFTKIEKITPIPCCPEHILGNMNLRGEILTLVDIRQPLNLKINSSTSSKNAAVIEVDDIVVGIAVEEVFDVVDLRPEELKQIPAAMDSNIALYLKGLADYFGKPLNVVDFSKLITQGAITVELAA